MGWFWGVQGREAAPAWHPEGTVSLPEPTAQLCGGGSPPARQPPANNGGFVRLRGLARPCRKGHLGCAGFSKWLGTVVTPGRAPPACPPQVSPCSAGTEVTSSLKHVVGAKQDGLARGGGWRHRREGVHGAPTPAGWQGMAEPGLGESEPRSSPQPENMNNSANICGAGAGEPSQGSSRLLAGRS